MEIIIKKDRKLCENCYNINRKYQNKTTFSRNDNNEKKVKNVNSVNINEKKTKVVDSVNNNNRTLIIGFSNCGKTYLMNRSLFQKQEPNFIITKSKNQNPNIKAQTSDEIEPLEKKRRALLFLTICCYQNKKAILFCFLLEVDIKILILTIFLRANLISQKILSVIFLI